MNPHEIGEPIDNAKLLELVDISVMAERRWLEQSLRDIGDRMVGKNIILSSPPVSRRALAEGLAKSSIKMGLLQLRRFPCGRVELLTGGSRLDSFQIVSVTIDP